MFEHLYGELLNLVFPPRCVVCGKVETWLCDLCARQIPLVDREICPRCGDAWTGPELCPRCRSTPLHVAPVRSAFLFAGPIRKAIHALKYRGARSVVAPLASRMAEAWELSDMSGAILVPVPLHPEREARRGYNQAGLLARALSERIRVPATESVLFRIRPTLSQTHLGREARWRNVQDAFACPDGCDLSGLHVTLIDDVATTGATLNACAVALLAQGASSVSAFTLAHAV
ncbi:MAG: ComF family protein [Anaerolineae bacterium]